MNLHINLNGLIELHKPVVKHFRKRKVIANGINEIWAVDLVDMQSFSKFNDSIKYLLMVIDVFSNYGRIVPLKSKTGIEVTNALNKIFKNRRCRKLWVNKGLEFYNKRSKALGVDLYSTENEKKSCVVERWNRTIKEKMFNYFSANSTRKYIDVLDEMVNKYNNTKHSSIKMTPVEARYTPRWSEEVFTVSQIQYRDPTTYKIIDDNGKEMQGTFYEQVLQKTNQEIFSIEKVIRKRGNKSLVK
ncbi:uncharacterized protein LOC136073016 [Hydra vulgaris]|uniref:uncharacterized protein LOC136073016 n=1 Tax=Hydra vulgaris TaxID=6087 RepID=UPI0032EA54B4